MKVDAVAAVRLDVGCEIAGRNHREIFCDGGRDRGNCGFSSGQAITAAIWQVVGCKGSQYICSCNTAILVLTAREDQNWSSICVHRWQTP